MGTELYTFLEGLEQAQVHCAFCSSVANAIEMLSSPQSPANRGMTLAVQCWQKLPVEKKLVHEVVNGLAELALQLWPDWYGQRYSYPKNTSKTEASETLSLPELSANIENLAGTWYKRAIKKIGEGKPPVFTEKVIKKETQLKQLALALAPEDLHIILVADIGVSEQTDAVSRSRAKSLAHVAGLLASCSGASVGMILPDFWQQLPELDHVNYRARIIVDERPAPEIIHKEVDACLTTGGKSNLWLYKGKPHHFSDVEKEVAKRIERNPQLHGLFHFNTIIKTKHYEPKVDMLWEEGKLVIEFDGHDHLNSFKYNEDRKRDYDLFMEGYRVIRFTNDACNSSMENVIIQIKNAVNMIRNSTTLEGGES